MFAVSVIFSINNEQIAPFRQLILEHAARTLEREEGCRQFDVGFDSERPQLVFLYELYDSPEAFEAHTKTDYLANFFATAGDWIESKEVNRWNIATA